MPGTLGHQNQATWCNESGKSLFSPPSVKTDKQRSHQQVQNTYLFCSEPVSAAQFCLWGLQVISVMFDI